MTALVPILILGGAALALGYLAMRWWGARAGVEYRREADRLTRVGALTVPEAASKLTEVLSNPQIFRTVESHVGDSSSLALLSPDVRRLFERYERIELVKVPYAVLDRSAVGPATHHERFVRIGFVEPGTDVEGEIAVLPGDARAYELHPTEPPDPTFGTFKSVYHWLLAVAEAT